MGIVFTIPGEPQGKARARTGKDFAFTPEKTVNYEALVKHEYYSKHQGHKLCGPLKITIHAIMSIPKSAKGKKKRVHD